MGAARRREGRLNASEGPQARHERPGRREPRGGHLPGVLLLGGATLGAYGYERSAAERILPGITVVGIEVGELSRPAAVAEVRGAADAVLGRELVVRAGDETISVPVSWERLSTPGAWWIEPWR